jgi:hypothetical protein
MKKIVVLLLGIMASMLGVAEISWAWNDKETHPSISASAIESSVLNLEEYVRDKFGFKEGLFSLSGSASLRAHLRNGSELEDAKEPPNDYRAKNHFHDPTKPFDQAGLNNPNPVTDGMGQSAILWGESSRENVWNLEDFYRYLYNSFTVTDADGREESLALVFRTAGHLLHLLQDMSVPAHVRNDLLVDHTMKAVFDWPPTGSLIEAYLQDNPRLIMTVPGRQVPSFDRYSDYFDTGYYRTHQDQPVSGNAIGLAEYVNSNFFTEYQRLGTSGQVWPHVYPHPNLDDTYYYDKELETIFEYRHLVGFLPPLFYSAYIGRDSSDPERSIRHLGRVGFFHKYNLDSTTAIFLDEACHIDYLDKLVPKAVAYSAGLLEFLFRGDIDFALDLADYTIDITNNSTKAMNGDFELYYDTNKGFRERIPGTMALAIPPGETVTTGLPFTSLPRDLGIEKVFTVTFSGALGLAEGVVTGRTAKLAPWEFGSGTYVEYEEIDFTGGSENYFSSGPGTGTNTRIYSCGFAATGFLSDLTVVKKTRFSIGVAAAPDILKKLGYKEGEREGFSIDTNSFSDPGLVDYLKVSTAPGEWVYVYDASGLNPDGGEGGVGYPASYREGLFGYGTGYRDLYWSLGSVENNPGECFLDEWDGSRPRASIHLYYAVPGHVPECPNADDLLATGRAYCSSYGAFFNQMVSDNVPYLPLMYSDDWRNYGFELRVNRLVAFPARRGDGVIYDSPVTFTREYGSTDLLVQ